MIHPDRITLHRPGADYAHGKYVVYWMQQSQRVEDNHAFSLALELARERQQPLHVCFVLTPSYPEANLRHYTFMIEGLFRTRRQVQEYNAGFSIVPGEPVEEVPRLAGQASVLVMDRGYLEHHRRWREEVIQKMPPEAAVYEVESDVLVPVEEVSDHVEYAARTLRPKLYRRLDEFIDRPSLFSLNRLPEKELADFPADPAKILQAIEPDAGAYPSRFYEGGPEKARRQLENFLEEGLFFYDRKNDPADDLQSGLSPYLHFGQISPLTVYRHIRQWERDNPSRKSCSDAFLEELVVRRELACNFTRFQEGYDRFENMTVSWARETMQKHDNDPRPFLYSYSELAEGRTHDPYWNAAVKEMIITGKMHSYMRMYWAKKIIEWTSSFRQAYETILSLNNRYFLDGRDPNSFAGVAWCFGRHDQAWKERPVFGKLRYMNARGLERKFEMESYLERIGRLE